MSRGTPFPPAFQTLLRELLRRAPDLAAAREADQPGRRRVRAQSGTFAGHRDYAQGDDLRLLDWNALARTGELFVKLLEEEERRTLTVCVDATSSMATGDPDRLVGALRLAAVLGGLGLTRLDGVALVAGAQEPVVLQGPARLPGMLAALDAVAAAGPVRQTPIELARSAVGRGLRGTLLWISDFADPDAFEPALRWMSRRGVRCRGWLPSLPTDRDPALDGWVRLIDPETGTEHALEIDAALRAAMKEELQRLERHQNRVFAQAGFPLVRFPLPADDDFRVAAWLRMPWTGF